LINNKKKGNNTLFTPILLKLTFLLTKTKYMLVDTQSLFDFLMSNPSEKDCIDYFEKVA